MLKKIVFSCIILSNALFAGGDPLSFRLDLPLVQMPHVPHVDQTVVASSSLSGNSTAASLPMRNYMGDEACYNYATGQQSKLPSDNSSMTQAQQYVVDLQALNSEVPREQNYSLQAPEKINKTMQPHQCAAEQVSMSHQQRDVNLGRGGINDHAQGLTCNGPSSYRYTVQEPQQKSFDQLASEEVDNLQHRAETVSSKHLGEVVQDAKSSIRIYRNWLRENDFDVNITPAREATLNGFYKALNTAEARLQKSNYQRIVHCMGNLVKLKMKQHRVRKQENYIQEIAAYKNEKLSEFKQEQVHNSVEDLRLTYNHVQANLAYREKKVSDLTTIVNRAAPNALQPRLNLACAEFNVGMEKGKQEIIEGLIQQKTFTSEYKNNLSELQQKLENTPQAMLSESDVKHLSAIEETIKTNGAVHKVNVTCKSEAANFSKETVGYYNQFEDGFVGNAYENQIYEENLENISLAADLHMTSYSDESAGDCAEAIVHFSNSAVIVLKTDPTSAHYLTNISTAITKIGTGCADIAKGCVKGIALGVADTILTPLNIIADPMGAIKQIDQGLGKLCSLAYDMAKRDPKALATFDKVVTEFMNQPLEVKAEYLSRFTMNMLAPTPGKLLKIPGVKQGFNALQKIGTRELAAIRAATKTSKLEMVTLNGVKTTKNIADQISTLEKGAGRVLSTEETANVVRNFEGQLAGKAPVTSAFARGVENAPVTFKDGLNFSHKPGIHMGNPDRFVPVQILKEAVTSGKEFLDPWGSSAKMYYTTMFKNGKMYNLEVLYNKGINTVYHFEYTQRAIGPLSKIK